MTASSPEQRRLTVFMERLREIPFVRDVEFADTKLGPHRPDALVTLRTPRRKFKLVLEVKQTFLDRALTNALIAEHAAIQREYGFPLLLAARYIPRPTGERLAEAGVNFVDRVGNIHLKLGDEYQIFLLGQKERLPRPAERRPSPALVQLQFVLLAEPKAPGWSIRKLAAAAGIGKTMAAVGRKRLLREGLLRTDADTGFQVTDHKKLGEDFLVGYNQILRPHLLLGTFRAQEGNPDILLQKLATAAERDQIRWAVTGGPAAYTLERFYRGEEMPVFIARLHPELRRDLRLVPDDRGPCVFLRSFGDVWAWQTIGGVPVAHPWLIYAELLHKGEPRALEAAQQIRAKYLSQ